MPPGLVRLPPAHRPILRPPSLPAVTPPHPCLWVWLQGYDLPGLQSQDAKCDQVFQRVQNVAENCYPSETALPLDHIVLRLEQMAAGQWPARQSPLDDYRCVPDAMVKVCPDQLHSLGGCPLEAALKSFATAGRRLSDCRVYDHSQALKVVTKHRECCHMFALLFVV